VCLNEIGDSLDDNLRHLALGMRLSNLENDEFMKFLKADDNLEIDHEAQLKEFLKG